MQFVIRPKSIDIGIQIALNPIAGQSDHHTRELLIDPICLIPQGGVPGISAVDIRIEQK